MSDKPKITALSFERRYSDDSGVEFAVRLKGQDIEFERIDTLSFPIKELDWLIACLQKIAAEARQGGETP